MAEIPELLSFDRVREITGRSRAEMYADIRAGRFPRPVKIGPGWRARNYFKAEEVAEWRENLRRADFGGQSA